MTDTERGAPSVGERVSAMEVTVAQMHADIVDLKLALDRGLRDLQQTINGSARTNWGVVLAGIMVALALYAAAIRPVESDVARLAVSAKVLADAVLEQNKTATESQVRIAILEYRAGLRPPDVHR